MMQRQWRHPEAQQVLLRLQQHKVKGFLAEDEGEALFSLALATAAVGPCLEVGSYCGYSTAYLGSACARTDNILFALDHHRGSEEHQLGEAYHDADLYDANAQCMDSFPTFRRTLALFELENQVVPVVAPSQVAVKKWATPLGLVFIDGGHSHETAMADCTRWSAHLLPGGLLAIHDIFANPAEGGQGPYLALQAVMASGAFEWCGQVNSLGILRRL